MQRHTFLAVAGAFGAIMPSRVEGKAMTHVAMLGDSIFDNGPYIGNAPDVRAQVDAILSAAKVSSAARDGAVIANIGEQLRDVPSSATHMVVSIGGNNALGASGILEEGASNVSDALEKIAASAMTSIAVMAI